MTKEIKQNWDYASWEGSRRALIRKSLKLTVRQRLQALKETCLTSQKLSSISKTKQDD